MGRHFDEGGYVAVLGRTGNSTQSRLDELRSRHWLDSRTVAVAFEFAFYNVNVNLACLVLLLVEFSTAGGVRIRSRADTMRLFRSAHSFDVFITLLEIVYVIFTVYMIVTEVKKIRKQKFKYVTLLGCVDSLICLTSMTAVILYIIVYVQGEKLIDLYKSEKDMLAGIQTLANQTKGLVILTSLLITLGSVRLLRLLRFNPMFFRLMMTLKKAIPKIFSGCFLIGSAYMAYSSFITLLFGHQVEIFSSMSRTLRTFYEGALGVIYMEEITDAYPFWGPFLYILFVMVSVVIFVSLVITLLIETTTAVKSEPSLSEDRELINIIFYKIVQWFAIRRDAKPGK